VKTLDLFVSFYGAEAGNLALKAMAAGGIFIGGSLDKAARCAAPNRAVLSFRMTETGMASSRPETALWP
jgi:Glucokinase